MDQFNKFNLCKDKLMLQRQPAITSRLVLSDDTLSHTVPRTWCKRVLAVLVQFGPSFQLILFSDILRVLRTVGLLSVKMADSPKGTMMVWSIPPF